jgi:hypothetical protein
MASWGANDLLSQFEKSVKALSMLKSRQEAGKKSVA